MARLTKKQIFAAKLPSLDVTVEEWGGEVTLCALTAQRRLSLLDAIATAHQAVEDYEADQALPIAEQQGVPVAKRLDEVLLQIMFSIVDERGNPLFDLADYDQFEALNYPTIKYLYAELMGLENRDPTMLATLKKTSR